MQAWVYSEYGTPDVLRLVTDLPEPTPKAGEVVVDVHALAINPKDVLVRKGKFSFMPWVRLPLIPGHDLAGTVVAAGPGADLTVGQRVYGWVESFTGGASAERVAIPTQHLAPIPNNLTMEQAAAIPLAGLTAFQALRNLLKVAPGEHVVLNGASGGVGTFAIQMAVKMMAHVTAVCSPKNADLVRSLGAHNHLDYTTTDPLSLRNIDVFFDIFGNKPWHQAQQTLRKSGRYCTTIPRANTLAQGALASVGLHRAHLVVVRSRRADLLALRPWIETGEMRPVVETTLPWTELPRSHELMQTRHTRGKIVLVVKEEHDTHRK